MIGIQQYFFSPNIDEHRYKNIEIFLVSLGGRVDTASSKCVDISEFFGKDIAIMHFIYRQLVISKSCLKQLCYLVSFRIWY